jgi:hypothetical protein
MLAHRRRKEAQRRLVTAREARLKSSGGALPSRPPRHEEVDLRRRSAPATSVQKQGKTAVRIEEAFKEASLSVSKELGEEAVKEVRTRLEERKKVSEHPIDPENPYSRPPFTDFYLIFAREYAQPGTLRGKFSHLKAAREYFLEEKGLDLADPKTMFSVFLLRDWGLRMASEGMPRQSVVNYEGTLRHYLVISGRLEAPRNAFPAHALAYLRHQVLTAVKRHAVNKAAILGRAKFDLLPPRMRLIVLLQLLSAYRRSTYAKIQRGDAWWATEDDGSEVLVLYGRHFKAIDSRDTSVARIGCNCSPDPAITSKYCVVHCEELRKHAASIFPTSDLDLDTCYQFLGISGHSPRRTAAVWLALMAAEENADIVAQAYEVFKFKKSGRISRKSNMFSYYASGFESLRGFAMVPCPFLWRKVSAQVTSGEVITEDEEEEDEVN